MKKEKTLKEKVDTKIGGFTSLCETKYKKATTPVKKLKYTYKINKSRKSFINMIDKGSKKVAKSLNKTIWKL